MKKEEKVASVPVADEPSVLSTLVEEHWSSHPQSLERQRKGWFFIGLVPVAVVFALFAWLLTGASGWRAVVHHPTIVFWILGGSVSLTLGLVVSFAVLHLVARSGIAGKTDDPDALPFPRALVVLFSIFWVVPAFLSLLQSQWGIRLVPQQMLFVLHALCFAPFLLLLFWIRFAGGEDPKGKPRTARRPVWFVLATLFLALAGMSLVGDLQGWVARLRLPPPFSGLSTLAMRCAALVVLLPLSMVCYAVWILFRRSMPREEVEREKRDKGKKSLWRRFVDFLRGLGGSKKTEEEEPNEDADDVPPAWLGPLCDVLRTMDVRIATKNPPAPDRFPNAGTPFSPVSTAPDADPFWMLMGGGESRRPTELQVTFFERFRNSPEESRQAACAGKQVSPDLILAGDEGSGRTEALLAAAMYAAFVRRQRVLYLVSDAMQAEVLSERANARFKGIFLDCFLRAGIFDGEKARRWVETLKEREKDLHAADAADEPSEEFVPPNVLFSTPRDVERIFFEGQGVDADASAVGAIREFLRLFEVVLVDDFMELDVAERAHLPFLLHKMRMLLVSGNLRPQFVVVTPRLREGVGTEAVALRLFGSAFNLAANVVTLLPRPCEPAWSLPLVVKDGVDVGAACEQLVGYCLAHTALSGTPFRAVLYRKGLRPYQCRELESKIVPDEARRKNLQVVSQLDEIDGTGGADAVFYLTALAGHASMALRLSVGDGKTVYLSLSSESEAVVGEAGGTKILPAIPDSSAVSLRIHHLRSLLRFVVPGQPVDVSAWERFGISLSSGRLKVVEVGKDAVIHEKWRHDEWNEPEYGTPGLRPYVAFEGDGSVKSNAGKGTDFGILPYTDEDVARLGDQPLIGLVRPKVRHDGKVEGIGIGATSLAKWVDAQGNSIGVIDLAHAESLVMGRSSHGDTYATAANAVDTVFTVQAMQEHEADDPSCVLKLTTKTWNGNGVDFDTPVRILSWTIEAGGVPQKTDLDSARAFYFFDLPDCRDLPRAVSAWIKGLCNRVGQDKPNLVAPSNSASSANGQGNASGARSPGGKPTPEEPKPDYTYQAYFSGILLAPRRLHEQNREAFAQIQRGIVGNWRTDEENFSLVLTHLLTGVLSRIVPDLPFYALVPVFHQRGKDGAVAAAVAWIVQPRNSGRTVEDLLAGLFVSPGGQETLLAALREARKLFEAHQDNVSRLRWLRSFSRSAFKFDLEKEGASEAFERDVKWSMEVLSVIDSRISGTIAEIEEFAAPVPGLARDHNWMSMPKTFVPDGFQPESIWTERGELPVPPELGKTDAVCRWHHGGKEFSVGAGFPEPDGKARYVGFVANSFRKRIARDSYVEYGFNDPYREFMGDLCRDLRNKFDAAFPKATSTQLAEYLLSFVQEGLPYVKDPKDKDSDWPRYPSETLIGFAGDCEDSSILYAELLRRSRIEGAILSIPEHAAVGVNVPLARTSDRQEPIVYTWLGKGYVYAETACNHHLRPLGAKTNLIRSVKDMPADIIPTPSLVEDETTPVRILNAVGPNSGGLEVTLVAPGGTASPLAVVVFARPRKGVFDEPDAKGYPCVGGAWLPPLHPRKVVSAKLKLDTPSFPTYWYDVFVCEKETGEVRGHFVGVDWFEKKAT